MGAFNRYSAEDTFRLARNSPMPDNMGLAEMMLFAAARNIHKAYRDGAITAEQAKEEKRLLIRQYNEYAHKQANADEERRQLFRLKDGIMQAAIEGKPVRHTHMMITSEYKIRSVIARYATSGWAYSLELIDDSGCVVIAALNETEVKDNVQ